MTTMGKKKEEVIHIWAPYTWLWFPNSRSLSRSARGSTPASSITVSPLPWPERRKGKADREGRDEKDKAALLFLPGFSPVCDEIMLLPTCWELEGG
jgi:hypothetical protein